MLRELEGALLLDARQDVEAALRVSVCLSNGLSRAQTAERLGIATSEVKAGVERLRSAASRLGWGPVNF
jgi:hypothetical protein